MTNNKTVLSWLEEMKALVTPDEVVWIDGSEAVSYTHLDVYKRQAQYTTDCLFDQNNPPLLRFRR